MNSFQEDPARNLPLVKQPPQPGERPARGWQIAITLAAAVAIVAVFLWGINNERPEGGQEQTAATQPAPATPHSANPQGAPPTTTGQGTGNQENGQPDNSRDRKAGQQPSKPPQSAQPMGGGQSSQPPKAQ